MKSTTSIIIGRLTAPITEDDLEILSTDLDDKIAQLTEIITQLEDEWSTI